CICDRAADVGQQPPALAPHRGGNVTVLLREADGFAERRLHLPDKTFEPGKYCREAPAGRGTGRRSGHQCNAASCMARFPERPSTPLATVRRRGRLATSSDAA